MAGRKRKIPKKFVPNPWISDSENENDSIIPFQTPSQALTSISSIPLSPSNYVSGPCTCSSSSGHSTDEISSNYEESERLITEDEDLSLIHI